MRYVDTQQTVPALFIYIALAVLYGPSLALMVVVFGLFNWGDVARLVRSEALQVREMEFITVARGAGVTPWQVVRHHVLPNVTATVLSVTALKLPLLVTVEATLSYLKFGDPRIVSWGNVVSVGVLWHENPALYWWVGVVPIGALVVTALAISLFGTALQDALDPRHVQEGSR
jgi:peptide/nickel transport system permease protein